MSADDQKSDPLRFVDRLRDLGRHLEATTCGVHPRIADVNDLVVSDLNSVVDPIEDYVVLIEAIRIAQLDGAVRDRDVPARVVYRSLS